MIQGQNTHNPQKPLDVTPHKFEILLPVTQTVIGEFMFLVCFAFIREQEEVECKGWGDHRDSHAVSMQDTA